MQEVWKDLPGWVGVFQVSNTGRARAVGLTDPPSVARRVWRSKTMRLLLRSPGMKSECPSLQQAIHAAFGPDPMLCLRPEDAWLEGEEWRPVVGWEGFYCISNLGRVKSVGPPGPNLTIGRVLKPRICKGYQRHALCGNGRRVYVNAYVLVAEAFIGPRPDGCDINHIDGKRDNSRPENLEYVTRRQNCLHAARIFGNMTGERNHAAKIKREDAEEMRRLYATGLHSQEAIGKKFGVAQAHVSRIVRGDLWVDRSTSYRDF